MDLPHGFFRCSLKLFVIGAMASKGGSWFRNLYQELMSEMEGFSGILKFRGLVSIPAETDTHEINFPPSELKFLWLQRNTLGCIGHQGLIDMPEGFHDVAVVQEGVVDTLILPHDTLNGVVKVLCVCVAGEAVARGGPAVLQSSLWSDEGGETATLLVQFHLVVIPVDICYCLEGMLGNAGNHVEGSRGVVCLPSAHSVKALVINGAPWLAGLFSHHHHAGATLCAPRLDDAPPDVF